MRFFFPLCGLQVGGCYTGIIQWPYYSTCGCNLEQLELNGWVYTTCQVKCGHLICSSEYCARKSRMLCLFIAQHIVITPGGFIKSIHHQLEIWVYFSKGKVIMCFLFRLRQSMDSSRIYASIYAKPRFLLFFKKGVGLKKNSSTDWRWHLISNFTHSPYFLCKSASLLYLTRTACHSVVFSDGVVSIDYGQKGQDGNHDDFIYRYKNGRTFDHIVVAKNLDFLKTITWGHLCSISVWALDDFYLNNLNNYENSNLNFTIQQCLCLSQLTCS